MSKRVDLTGQQMNEWKVLKYLGDSKYLCRCSCGKEKEVSGYALKKGTSKSCGHTTRVNTTRVNKDIKIGDTFGMLSVKEFIGGGKWKCECSCGDTVIALGKYLKTGKIVSCGKHKMEDLTGKTFGYWKVIKYAGNLRWTCQCKCGTVRDVLTQALKSGRSKSCGCGGRDVAANYREKMLAKYGDISINRANNPRQPWQIETLQNPEILQKLLNELNQKNNSPIKISKLAEVLDSSYVTVARALKRANLTNEVDIEANASLKETQLYEWISSIYTGQIIRNDRDLIYPYEIDIVIPDKKLAIEFNGTFWHSDIASPNKYYHLMKSNMCNKLGYKLIHIFEYEWDFNNAKVKQLLAEAIMGHEIIHTEKFIIHEISKDMADKFMSKHHIFGPGKSSINIGIVFDERLMAVMSINKLDKQNRFQYEITRIARVNGIAIEEDISIMCKYFINKYKPTSVVINSDIAKFSWCDYSSLGMHILGKSEPNYIWANQKQETVHPGDEADMLLSKSGVINSQDEDNCMRKLGYFKIYDCGNMIYAWKKQGGIH